MSREIVTDGRHIPDPVTDLPYWVVWDFETKQPLAPWMNGHCYPAEWRQDGDADPRTTYAKAAGAADLGASVIHESYPFPDGPPNRVGPTILLPHEGEDTPGPEPADPPLLFIDYDDVVGDGEIPDEVWDIAASIGGPVFASRSTFFGKDPGGLHQLARGTLPGRVTTVNVALEERGHVEIYYRSRMTGFTWEHIRGTPTDDLPVATEAIAELIERYGDEATRRRAGADPDAAREPQPVAKIDPDEIPEETTDDIEHVFAAIRQVGPRDISLRSEMTEDRGGRKSWDPSWSRSQSGTRLGWDAGVGTWMWRKGSHPIDALQVVAAEEGIIADVTTYPEGERFWRAVSALRRRGARVPYFEGDDGRHPDVLQLFEDPEDDEDARRKAIRAMLAAERDWIC